MKTKSLKEVFLSEGRYPKAVVDGMEVNIGSLLKKAQRIYKLTDKLRVEISYLMVLETLEGENSGRKIAAEVRAFNKRLERAHNVLDKISSALFTIKQESGAPD